MPQLCRHLNAASMVILIGAVMATALSAEPPKNGAKLVIQSAQYGDLANDKSADVTAKVVAAVKDDNLSINVGGNLFGDPAPNAPKKLKVGYTIDGIYHSKTVEEGDVLDISTRLIIRKAVYGDLPSGDSVDVTEDVAAMVRNNSLTVKAGNETFGDPAGGKVKKFRVDYSFDGKTKTKTVPENSTLAISEKGE